MRSGLRMILDGRTVSVITDCISSLPLWSKYSRQAAVVLTGSRSAGLTDDQSDIDIDLLLPEPAFTEMYEPLWEAIDDGRIQILNPRARVFHEYPITYFPGIDGHYHIKSAVEAETQICAMNDVVRWIYCNSEAITDERGLHARLRALACSYPAQVVTEKRSRELFAAKEYFYGLKTQLERDHHQSILLLGSQSISHVLKFFCLCDNNPFPYEKWLYQVGIETTLGHRAGKYVEAILAELGRESVVRESPKAYVEPGHRNEEFEEYRLYHLFMLMFREIDAFRRENYPDEVK